MLEVVLSLEDVDIFKSINFPEIVDDALKDITETIKEQIIALSPVGEKEHAPRFKDQWSVVQQEQGGYSFSNPAPYAYRLEYGTWPGVGPRTGKASHATTGEEGIFSTQTIRGGVAGIIGLYLSDPERIQWIADEVTKRVKENLEKL